MRIAAALGLIFVVSLIAYAQVPKKRAAETEITFCELVRNAEKYKDQDVLVKGTYRFAFEQSELYCLGCPEKSVWVEFDDAFKKHSKRRLTDRLKFESALGGTVNVKAVGTLSVGGHFGHFGIYDFRFTIKSLKMVEIVEDTGVVPRALSKAQQKKVCQK